MVRPYYTLVARINHQTFDIAKKMFGLTDGRKTRKRNQRHNQPCILPGCNGDDFHFLPKVRMFRCEQCGFRGKIFRLTEKVFDKSFVEAFDMIAEVAGCHDLIPEK